MTANACYTDHLRVVWLSYMAKSTFSNVLLNIFQNIQNIRNIQKYTISYCHMGFTVGNTRNQIKISRCQRLAIVLIARFELAAQSLSLNYGLELPTWIERDDLKEIISTR